LSRGKWVGIGIVIGVVATLVAASLILTMSPRTAEAMHLLRVSTVTMPIYAGTRTVTTTATTTVTKYLGGKVVTVTSTATRTVTTTVTATPRMMTTTFRGNKVLVGAYLNGVYYPLDYIKIHNHTLYVLVKTVTRTITVPRSVSVALVSYGMMPVWNKSSEYLHQLIRKIVENASMVYVVGVPAMLYIHPHEDLVLATKARIKYFIVTDSAVRRWMLDAVLDLAKGFPLSLIDKGMHTMLKYWRKVLNELQSAGYHIMFCKVANPREKVFGADYCIIIVTDKYVLALPCDGEHGLPAILMKYSDLKKVTKLPVACGGESSWKEVESVAMKTLSEAMTIAKELGIAIKK